MRSKTQTLTLAMMLLAVPALGLAQADAPAAHFMEQWDADADGQVTLAEAQTKRGEVFYMFDQDGDKALNAAEWALVAEHMQAEMDAKAETQPGTGAGNGAGQGAGKGMGGGQGGRGPGQAIHAAMTPEFNDADGDGRVSEAEFLAATDRLFAALDRNADGAVSQADFAPKG